jgi:hypothetical protein
MKCYNCDAELRWCCDYEADEYDEGYSIVTDLCCPDCDAMVVVYWGKESTNEESKQ